MLVAVCDEGPTRLAGRPLTCLTWRRRPKGPASGSAATDQAGITEAIAVAWGLVDLSGHRRRTFLRRAADVDGGSGQPRWTDSRCSPIRCTRW